MSLSMYQASAPVFIRQLMNLSAILTKAVANADERKIEHSVLLNSRLAPDMLPLVRQIQITSDSVKAGVARLAGLEAPSFPDTETTFEELQERIAKTIAYAQEFTAEQIDGTEAKAIVVKSRSRERHFNGHDYLFNYTLPNVFFHITTAYAILRHNGVPLGKMDFLGTL